MKIIVLAIQKGGTGKTTSAAALAHAAALDGFRVLCVDLDPQGQLSFTMGADVSRPGAFELITGAAAAADLVQTPRQGGPDIIPAAWELATITTGPGSARRLQRALEPVRGQYDFIIIDTPPTAGELQFGALQAATELIIPVQADIYSLQSLYQIADTAGQIRRTNPGLSIRGFILTDYDGRGTISRTMAETITARAAEIGIKCLGVIRRGVAVKEAAALQEPLITYAPRSRPAQDYKNIFEQIKEGV